MRRTLIAVTSVAALAVGYGVADAYFHAKRPLVTGAVGTFDGVHLGHREVIRGADTVLTFGPDGVTGHPDHRTVNRWVRLAVDRSSTCPRILHPVGTGRGIEFDLAREFDMWALGGPRQCPKEMVALRIDLDGAELDRKVRALLAQRSQTADLAAAIGLERYRTWVSVEIYAHPA